MEGQQAAHIDAIGPFGFTFDSQLPLLLESNNKDFQSISERRARRKRTHEVCLQPERMIVALREHPLREEARPRKLLVYRNPLKRRARVNCSALLGVEERSEIFSRADWRFGLARTLTKANGILSS